MIDSHILGFIPYISRLVGFFLLSPLFFYWKIPWMAKLSLLLGCTLFFFKRSDPHEVSSDFSFFLLSLLELAAGYLLGLIFSLIFEGTLLAGQLVGTLSGFSALELMDPKEVGSEPIIGKTYSLLVAVLFFSLDFHHLLLRLLFENNMTSNSAPLLQTIAFGAGKFFEYALSYATLPLILLFSLNLFLLLLTRSLPPWFPLFWIAFPGQLLVGACAIVLSIEYFPDILHKALHELRILYLKTLGSP